MITYQDVTEMMLRYLNHEITLLELTEWAEMYTEPEDVDPGENALEFLDLMQYIAGKHLVYAPFSWHEILSVFEQTGTSIRVIQV
jgi:hypothetical protein